MSRYDLLTKLRDAARVRVPVLLTPEDAQRVLDHIDGREREAYALARSLAEAQQELERARHGNIAAAVAASETKRPVLPTIEQQAGSQRKAT